MLRLREFDFVAPDSIAGVLEVLGDEPGAVVVAGGTDLVPKLKRGQFEPRVVVSLSRVEELNFVDAQSRRLRIGALTTLRALERSEALRPYHSAAVASGLVATPIIRSMGTLGGNLLQDTRCRYYDRSDFWREAVGHCMKKDADVCRVAPGGSRCYATFCSDMAPALVVLEAQARLVGARGERTVPLESLYLDDGIDYLDVRREILADVTVEESGYRSTYKKLRVRDSFDFPEVGVAVAISGESASLSVRVAMAGIGSNVLVHRFETSEGGLQDAADRIVKDVRPFDTMFYPPAYRKKMARQMLLQGFDELLDAR
jgi:4-hydroxybenzoyl-CoA reductase subunit beta